MIYPRSQIWTPEIIADIHSRAQGDYLLSGFAPFRSTATFDELVFMAAGLTRFPLEGYKEKCKTQTTLGGVSSKPLVIETPVYVASSTEYDSDARAALALGSGLVQSAVSVGGHLVPEERRAKRLICQIAADSKKAALPTLRASAVQLNVSGGVSLEEVRDTVKRIRKGQEQRVPIFVSFAAGRVRDDVKATIKVGADVMVLTGLEPFAIHSVDYLMSRNRMPLIAAIPAAREALRESKALGEVNIVASGGIRNGADAAKALALGADAVAITESALVAIGYRWTPPVAAAGEALRRRGRMDVGEASERLGKFINSMTMEIALLARSLGKGDVHSLEFEDLASLSVDASLMSGVRLVGE